MSSRHSLRSHVARVSVAPSAPIVAPHCRSASFGVGAAQSVGATGGASVRQCIILPIPLPPLAANRRRGTSSAVHSDQVMTLVPLGMEAGASDAGTPHSSVQRYCWYSTHTTSAAPATLLIFSPTVRLVNCSSTAHLTFRVDCGKQQGIASGHVAPMQDAPLLLSPEGSAPLEVLASLCLAVHATLALHVSPALLPAPMLSGAVALRGIHLLRACADDQPRRAESSSDDTATDASICLRRRGATGVPPGAHHHPHTRTPSSPIRASPTAIYICGDSPSANAHATIDVHHHHPPPHSFMSTAANQRTALS